MFLMDVICFMALMGCTFSDFYYEVEKVRESWDGSFVILDEDVISALTQQRTDDELRDSICARDYEQTITADEKEALHKEMVATFRPASLQTILKHHFLPVEFNVSFHKFLDTVKVH